MTILPLTCCAAVRPPAGVDRLAVAGLSTGGETLPRQLKVMTMRRVRRPDGGAAAADFIAVEGGTAGTALAHGAIAIN